MRLPRWLLVSFLLLGSAGAAAAVNSLTLLALFGDKAMLHIDGQRRLMQTGETSPEGLTLVSADTNEAVVEIDGRREVLRLGMTTAFPGPAGESVPAWAGPESVSMWADDDGFFYVSGQINGYPVRFLVDTGATTIALSSDLARRIGIDYTKGRRGIANTAAGVTEMFGIELDSVDVGGINLRNVLGGVISGGFPINPLLGMSFLGHLDMVREGNRMELKRRN